MNHVSCFQLSRSCDRRVPNGNAANFVALLLNRFAALAKYHARHSRSQNQIVVCGVDDGINVHLGDVALLNENTLG